MGLKAEYWAKDPDAVVTNMMEQSWHYMYHSHYVIYVLLLFFFLLVTCFGCCWYRTQTQGRQMRQLQNNYMNNLIYHHQMSGAHYRHD